MVRALEELEELDLAGNELGDVAAVELGQAMIDMGDQCRVWNLDLRTNKINDLGLEAVAETLAQCPSLQVRAIVLFCVPGVSVLLLASVASVAAAETCAGRLN